ncbi:polyribonucleotide nucleotidyltransferase 1, mitochondrial-like [Homalodisca vitripennis]|uniref:polyribonucleotide nucleotidyltransferase 1, mitochondrial-like n=1 Tax=Homalodisca vitripennis TaxID=197043 RepID=UPI001EEB0AFE|nr:polyribonucleotide nucleotidyltransferase 1, mitochondrial-like [Homalodisca vitripennis]
MRLREVFQDYEHDKLSRDEAVRNIHNDVLEKIRLGMEAPPDQETLSRIFGNNARETFRDLIFENNKRCDGRRPRPTEGDQLLRWIYTNLSMAQHCSSEARHKCCAP